VLSEAVLLALATSCAYLLAYCFEAGYAEYFGVPTYLVRVSADTLLRVAAALLLSVGVLITPARSLWDNRAAWRPRKATAVNGSS